MSRPRKPTAVLELQGAFKKDPQRRAAREGEPQPDGVLGDPPGMLDASEREVWLEIQRVAPWLTDADRLIVEETCRLAVDVRKGQLSAAERSLYARNLGSLGLTPSGRAHVKAPPRKDAKSNPFQELTG